MSSHHFAHHDKKYEEGDSREVKKTSFEELCTKLGEKNYELNFILKYCWQHIHSSESIM